MNQGEIAPTLTKYVVDNNPVPDELRTWLDDNNLSKFDLAMVIIQQHIFLQKLEKIEQDNAGHNDFFKYVKNRVDKKNQEETDKLLEI